MRSTFLTILEDGGWVLYALVAVSFLMWWVTALRFDVVGGRGDTTKRRSDRVARFSAMASRAADQFANPTAKIDALEEDARKQLGAWSAVLKSLVAAAPMLGLLGTVGGMVETFASLHVSGLAHADASVAGGISTALLTTQLGLLVGVPGLIAARTLDRLEARRRAELSRIRQDILLRLQTAEAR